VTEKPGDFDLIVIGGGSGGLAGAFRAAQHGARVALLEPGALGGTCVNVGCVPKKAMWLAAELTHRIELAGKLGFDIGATPRLDWCEFVAHRQRYIENIHQSYRNRLNEAGVALLPCHGRFVAAREVEADSGVRLRAPHVLVATGGRPRRPPIDGAELALDSDGFFDLREAPARVALVGGGYIGVELAGVLQALGSRVDLFVRGRRLLADFDEDLTVQLAQDMQQHGTRIHFGSEVASVRQDGGKRRLSGTGECDADSFDAVLLATGRVPNTDALGLDRAGVALEASGHVRIDAWQNTSAAGIYAVGDATPQAALTPVAIAAARRLMDRLFGGQPDARLDQDDVATVVFAHPPLGKVGLTEVEARVRFGDQVRTYRSGFRPMLHALADSPQRSLFKLVCVDGEASSAQPPSEQPASEQPASEQRVVGIHLLGEAADEILQGFAVALKRGITLADLHATMAIHPTSAEEMVLMR
jgi:glutathione reductase (NADPH)